MCDGRQCRGASRAASIARMKTVLAALMLLALPAAAVETIVTVRAVSRDAKVIGDGVGGAQITIRDADSGKVLASGVQKGGTGDTKRIMSEARSRDAVVYGTEGAAMFRATLDLDRPTRVEITAEGPLKYPQAMQRASKTLLLLPGKHIEGEGVILEIHGFIVDILTPAAFAKGNEPRKLRVKVMMACGCPTEPGGMWNADAIAITAYLNVGKAQLVAPLKFAGEPSTYEAEYPPVEGEYEIEVLAADPSTGNFGRAVQKVSVQ